MVSYPRRLQSGHFTCYLIRTYHVLTTLCQISIDKRCALVYLTIRIHEGQKLRGLLIPCDSPFDWLQSSNVLSSTSPVTPIYLCLGD